MREGKMSIASRIAKRGFWKDFSASLRYLMKNSGNRKRKLGM